MHFTRLYQRISRERIRGVYIARKVFRFWEVFMKKIAILVSALTVALILAGCSSLKPFTQDELDRLSCADAPTAIIG